MKRSLELRPKKRTVCDLRGCHKKLDPGVRYPTLSEGGKRFTGVRVFCEIDHLDEYEMRIVLVTTKPQAGVDDHVPGIRGPSIDFQPRSRSLAASDGLDSREPS